MKKSPKLVELKVCSESKKKCRGCAQHGSAELIEALRAWTTTEENFKHLVLIGESGCLGECPKKGASAVLTPKEKIFKKVTLKNLDKVKRAIRKRVQKLRDQRG